MEFGVAGTDLFMGSGRRWRQDVGLIGVLSWTEGSKQGCDMINLFLEMACDCGLKGDKAGGEMWPRER